MPQVTQVPPNHIYLKLNVKFIYFTYLWYERYSLRSTHFFINLGIYAIEWRTMEPVGIYAQGGSSKCVLIESSFANEM